MSGRKNIRITLGLTVSVSLLAAAVSVLLFTFHYSRIQFEIINAVCVEIAEQEPGTTKIIAAALKEYTKEDTHGTVPKDLLKSMGYRISDFAGTPYRKGFWCIAAGFLASGLLFACTWLYRSQTENRRIQSLAEYLELADNGRAPILAASGEDAFSKLEDAIYKTVTCLYQAKEAAVQTKNGFAENLSNIAHQIKTPITAISLSVQMMEHDAAGTNSCIMEKSSCVASEASDISAPQKTSDTFGKPEQTAAELRFSDLFRNHLTQIKRQLLRLTRLEEALLLLSRIDAGTLSLKKEETDVYTLLVLAADNLQEIFAASDVSVEIPEQGGMMVMADLDWTMEAVMNLMKNCAEQTNGGTIHCTYEQNPLYTEILIWDEGAGFAGEDIPHLFKRFYRGQNAAKGGIGIGLALSREIIERQNGTLRARNKPGGGALFEIRFYSH